LGRLAKASIRTVQSSGHTRRLRRRLDLPVLRLAAMARTPPKDVSLRRATEVWLPSLDAVVHGVSSASNVVQEPAGRVRCPKRSPATWRIGMGPRRARDPRQTDGDEVVFTEMRIAGGASTIWRLATGTPPSRPAGNVTYPTPRARAVRSTRMGPASPARQVGGSGGPPPGFDRTQAGRPDAQREARSGHQRDPVPAGLSTSSAGMQTQISFSRCASAASFRISLDVDLDEVEPSHGPSFCGSHPRPHHPGDAEVPPRPTPSSARSCGTWKADRRAREGRRRERFGQSQATPASTEPPAATAAAATS